MDDPALASVQDAYRLRAAGLQRRPGEVQGRRASLDATLPRAAMGQQRAGAPAALPPLQKTASLRAVAPAPKPGQPHERVVVVPKGAAARVPTAAAAAPPPAVVVQQKAEKLPKGWIKEEEPVSGIPMYRHLATGEVQYERPRPSNKVSAEEEARAAAMRAADPRRSRHDLEDSSRSEPRLQAPKDLAAWQEWARAQALDMEHAEHPRTRGPLKKALLPLWATTQAEIASFFGVGAELYFVLLRYCQLVSLLGIFLSSPSLVFSLVYTTEPGSPYSGSIQSSGLASIFALTTVGARVRCSETECRLVNCVCAFLELLFCALILLGLSHLHSHVERISSKLGRAQVTIGDYSVELTGLASTTTAAQVRDMIHAKLQRHAKKRLLALTANELKARQGSRRRQVRPAERSGESTPGGAVAASKSHARLARELAECRRIVDEEMWRVFDVQLMVDNGKMLLQGLRKAPLERELEMAQAKRTRRIALTKTGWATLRWSGRSGRSSRISEPSDRTKNNPVLAAAAAAKASAQEAEREARRKTRKGGPYTRWVNWRLAQKIHELENKLAVSRSIISAAAAAQSAQKRTVSAVITFGHEAGRLECLRAFSPWLLVPLCLRRRIRLGNAEFNHYFAEGKLLPVEARPVPEPRQLLLHNLEYRGSAGNACRQLCALLFLVFLLVLSALLVFFSKAVSSLRFDGADGNATATLCAQLGARWDDEAAASSATCGTDVGTIVLPFDGGDASFRSVLLRALPARQWNATVSTSDPDVAWASTVPDTGRPFEGSSVSSNVVECKRCFCESLIILWANDTATFRAAEAAVGPAAWADGGPLAPETLTYCAEHWVLWYAAAYGAPVLSSVVILLVNQGLKLTVYALAPKMRHHTYTARTLWTYARLFLFQFVNTGLVVLIVSGGLPNAAMEYLEGASWNCPASWASSTTGPRCLIGRDGYILSAISGNYFDAQFYVDVGGQVGLTMVLMVVTMNLEPFIFFARHRLRRRCLFRSRVTLDGVLKLFRGPHFPYAQRYAQVYLYLGLVLTYGAGMPVVYALGFIFFIATYWVDKWALLRYYRLPERVVDERLLLGSLKWVKWLVLIHVLMAFLAFRELHDTLDPDVSGLSQVVDVFIEWSGTGLSDSADRSLTLSRLLTFILLLAVAVFVAANFAMGVRGSRLLHRCFVFCSSLTGGKVGKRVGPAPDARLDAAIAAAKAAQKALSSEVGEREGLPPFAKALVGGAHPALRTLPGGGGEPELVHLSEVGVRVGLLERCNPFRFLFEAVGLSSLRREVPWERWVTEGKPIVVKLTGDGKTSYDPTRHPAYREAFIGSEEVAKRLRRRYSCRPGDQG